MTERKKEKEVESSRIYPTPHVTSYKLSSGLDLPHSDIDVATAHSSFLDKNISALADLPPTLCITASGRPHTPIKYHSPFLLDLLVVANIHYFAFR